MKINFLYCSNVYLTFMAVGALESVTSVPAASYLTAGLEEFSKLYIHLINLALSEGLAWQTYKIHSYYLYIKIAFLESQICKNQNITSGH